jgi:hypothetical protein
MLRPGAGEGPGRIRVVTDGKHLVGLQLLAEAKITISRVSIRALGFLDARITRQMLHDLLAGAALLDVGRDRFAVRVVQSTMHKLLQLLLGCARIHGWTSIHQTNADRS